MATVFLDGRFLTREEARVSAFDAGVQHAVGLFETMTAVVETQRQRDAETKGEDAEREAVARVRVVHMDEHLRRLAESARALQLSESLRLSPLSEAVQRTVARASMESPDQERFRVRLTITGGDMSLAGKRRDEETQRRRDEEGQRPTVLIVAQAATAYPAEMFQRGVAVTIADLKANPFNPMEGHKTLGYWARLRELQNAGQRGGAEALVFSVTNHVVGGCVSNVLVVKGGRVTTPVARGEETERRRDEETKLEEGLAAAGVEEGDGEREENPPPAPSHREGSPSGGRGGMVLPSPVLPGITRAWALDVARASLIDVEKRMLAIDDVLDADEVLLTNSSWGVLPVVRVEKEAIGDGVVGEVGRKLVGEWGRVVGAQR